MKKHIKKLWSFIMTIALTFTVPILSYGADSSIGVKDVEEATRAIKSAVTSVAMPLR